MLVVAASLAGCGGGGGSSSSNGPDPSLPQPVNTRAVPDSDLEIAQKIYSDSQRTPTDFYADPAPSGIGNVSTFHLKNTDLQSNASPAIHELCTDDWNQALQWSEGVATAAATYSDLVGNSADSRLFEFDRSRRSQPAVYERARVYKCSYLDRTPVDLRVADGAAGKLNQLPPSASELKDLSEYLWRFTTYNNFGNVVLKSSGGADSAALDHTLIIGTLVRNGTSASCDRVDVVAWKHSADGSGTLTRSVTTLWSFGAKESSGVAQLCSG
jgi:hypothetical protein